MDNYKVLGQVVTTGDIDSDVVVYSPPSYTQASLSNISITNTSDESQTYSVAFAKSNELLDGYEEESINSIFVAIGTSTAIAATSADGITWTQRTMPASAIWTSVTYGNGTFVAVANNSSIAATSTNGITWTQRTMPASAIWTSVTYGNGTFVAVASSNFFTVATSPDGITWTERSLPSNFSSWFSVTYGNGTFVAVPLNGFNAITSPDGITWTLRSLPTLRNWVVTYGNGTFVAVAYGSSGFTTDTAATSPDGATWTQRTLPASDTGWNVTYGNGTFVAVGRTSAIAATSPDGATWTQRTLPTSATWIVTHGENIIPEKFLSSNAQKVITSQTIAAGETHEITGGIGLQAGDQLRINSSSNELIAHAYGVEIS